MGKIRQQHLVKSVCKLLMILVAEMKNLQAVSTATALDDAVFIISGVTRRSPESTNMKRVQIC